MSTTSVEINSQLQASSGMLIRPILSNRVQCLMVPNAILKSSEKTCTDGLVDNIVLMVWKSEIRAAVVEPVK